MKSILLSIKSKWVAKILNGEKTIEVRKNKALYKATMKLIEEQGYATFFIYCSKDSKNKLCYVNYEPCGNKGYLTTKLDCEGEELNGKVVARFWCDEVLPIIKVIERCGLYYYTCQTEQFYYNPDKLTSQSCLNTNQIRDYLGDKNGYAIHFSKLEIFDKPKELADFWHYKGYSGFLPNKKTKFVSNITKAPQNFCYVESEEKSK